MPVTSDGPDGAPLRVIGEAESPAAIVEAIHASVARLGAAVVWYTDCAQSLSWLCSGGSDVREVRSASRPSGLVSGEAVLLEESGDAIPSALAAAVRRAGGRYVSFTRVAVRRQTAGWLGCGAATRQALGRPLAGVLDDLAPAVAIAVENVSLRSEIAELRRRAGHERIVEQGDAETPHHFAEIIGRSTSLLRALCAVDTVAPSGATVLLQGETGTGKELIARAIHRLSARSGGPFVRVNCAAIPAGLLESELFGHEKGAFTGAIAQRIGRFERANRGTLFLDEIGELPLDLQPKLMRVLQERSMERVGGSRTIEVDVRIVAATNRDLRAMAAQNQFRPDLFYRLYVFPITLPALRERRQDIPLLVRHFVNEISSRSGKRIETIPSYAMSALVEYDWPGNVRELENLIERSVILTRTSSLHVPVAELMPNGSAAAVTLAETEREHILRALDKANWRIAGPRGAAAALGLKRTTLYSRMRKLSIGRQSAYAGL
jgi:formate hydrogenlyase transcriptional activator